MYIAATPTRIEAIIKAIIVICHPNKKPLTAISLMSPPPNALGTIKQIINIGKEITKTPIIRCRRPGSGKTNEATIAHGISKITSLLGIIDSKKSFIAIIVQITVMAINKTFSILNVFVTKPNPKKTIPNIVAFISVLFITHPPPQLVCQFSEKEKRSRERFLYYAN